HFPTVISVDELNLGARHRGADHDLVDLRGLGLRSLHELLARWDVVEKIAHLDRRSCRSARRPKMDEIATLDDELRAANVSMPSRAKAHPRDRSDGCECFSAKAKCSKR